jgi:hypothetical protein
MRLFAAHGTRGGIPLSRRTPIDDLNDVSFDLVITPARPSFDGKERTSLCSGIDVRDSTRRKNHTQTIESVLVCDFPAKCKLCEGDLGQLASSGYQKTAPEGRCGAHTGRQTLQCRVRQAGHSRLRKSDKFVTENKRGQKHLHLQN